MREHALGEPSPPPLRAKAATLDRLRRAGIPVPAGLVVPLPPPGSSASSWSSIVGDGRDTLLHELLSVGPVIVRSALAIEDQETTSGAGLGESIHGCTSPRMVAAALAKIAAARHTPALRSPDHPQDQAIIQREIAAVTLLVIAAAPSLATTVEVYRPGQGALCGGSTPSFAGPLARWPDSARALTGALVTAVREALADTSGIDLEIVIDADSRPWLVQARPLTRALQPGWASFSAALTDEGLSLPAGWWRLDTEHNPAPLSPAHASLLAWLAIQRPGTMPRTFAGWLYDSIALGDRAKDRAKAKAKASATADPLTGLKLLQTTAIPAARRQLRSIVDLLASSDRSACAAMIDRAQAASLGMIDIYASLAPARASARTAPSSPQVASDDTPLCLVDRRRFLDVLPCTWDIASPSLQEVDPDGSRATSDLPDFHHRPLDPSAATWLLRELDDHLFALGLAPLRRVYLRAAELLDVEPSQIFLLEAGALRSALLGDLPAEMVERLLHSGGQRLERSRHLRPPPHLFDGAPLPIPAYGHLRGLGMGEPCRGPVAQRSDLADLIARPPEDGSILVLPTLTVAAAVVLDRLGVRALCSASGGALSHAALIVRELGISALIGCRGATGLIDGELIELDTARGQIARLGPTF